MPYVATINVPGYLPMDDDPPVFDTAPEAWEWLANERVHHEDSTGTEGDPYTVTIEELRERFAEGDGPGVVYGLTPGSDSPHDLGLAYCVTPVED